MDKGGALHVLEHWNGLVRFVLLKGLNGSVVNELQNRELVTRVNEVFIRLIG